MATRTPVTIRTAVPAAAPLMRMPPADPTLARRARIARLTRLGQRVGYALFGAAIAVFAIGAAGRFTALEAGLIVACLVAGSVVLAPAIVFGYAVRAAEREERQRHGR